MIKQHKSSPDLNGGILSSCCSISSAPLFLIYSIHFQIPFSNPTHSSKFLAIPLDCLNNPLTTQLDFENKFLIATVSYILLKLLLWIIMTLAKQAVARLFSLHFRLGSHPHQTKELSVEFIHFRHRHLMQFLVSSLKVHY